MSFDYSFSFGPTTPPSFSFEEALNDASFTTGHRRSSSHVSSVHSHDSSPESIDTQLTTPARSPIRHHGPLLLPKIRPQDQEIHSSPKRSKKTPLSTATYPAPASSTFRPSHNRSFTNPESLSFIQHDNIPSQVRPMTTLCSPITLTATTATTHQRRASASSLDGQTLGKYGFPTYRQMPTYIPANSQNERFIPQDFFAPQRTPSPLQNSIALDEMTMSPLDACMTTTTLMSYLTSPNPAPALVRQLNIHIRDTNAKHFWWDIRQIRPWTSFTTSTISSIPGLHDLLNVHIPDFSLPVPVRASSQPETELELQGIYNSFYATKLNAALSLSLGPRHLVMRSSKGPDPSFISNYTDDTSQLIYGRGLGRVVGLVKSFDRWNTGMRVEGNHRKVQYLRGLAHLHRQMRENGCRYGFIITEIELIVVRNGAENVPHFGYLEVQTIQLAAHDTQTSTFQEVEGSFGDVGEENVVRKQPKMTALLALWYLHMLARDDTLPGQVSWKSEIGAPAEGTRRKCLPKDEWIPEPQLAEKREAKRTRGWIWPEESVGRKELGKRGVRYGGC
ncbi:hypothetical protein M430DRAFT_34478 [Amorphotheca resinae ATCC 22711]|uniref:Sialidase n=1 Tax=Amorphotheca resinae ATCC 22711 TaxID=857342 RepID=A0A2T3B376_AMORE|nr:hypothetical protein M430DRAFT_34478 [Amorphotheca resinae ATCC 22711]PSS20092.1 hypothetical protein M430DRAFT_34478 [Amorphotheca resinae ATCC 22711]